MALFAALIVPHFIDWNNYRSAFEAQASAILGHPVKVNGTASASVLPSPSLTFTDVEVDDGNGGPLMTVQRFSATVELVPLFQGQIHIVSLTLEQPDVRLAFDAAGDSPWLKRSAASGSIDPDSVAIEDLEVVNGRLDYSDARDGFAETFGGISATVDARSLLGPWHVEGSYLDQGVAVPFRGATGAIAADGSTRLQAEVSPRGIPYSVSTDGNFIVAAASGPSYRGTYTVSPVAIANKDAADLTGLRSNGMFALTPAGLAIDGATFATGPQDKATTVTGSVNWPFGAGASFTATLQARQLDLDRAAGASPGQPADVGAAIGQLVESLRSLPSPPIPGTIAFSVPAIVVGGSLVQGVSLNASSNVDGWSLDNFHLRMPGQSTLDATGKIATGGASGFIGNAHLVVPQSAPFVAWITGKPVDPTRLLPSLDVSGEVDLAATRLALDKATVKIGAATISGSAYWEDKDSVRTIGMDLAADSLDYDAIQPLAGLATGSNLSDVGSLADNFQIRLMADSLAYQDFAFKGVAVDAGYSDDSLIITRLAAGFDGGTLSVSGRLDGVKAGVHGRIDGKLDATSFDVPTRLCAARSAQLAAGQLAPGRRPRARSGQPHRQHHRACRHRRRRRPAQAQGHGGRNRRPSDRGRS